MTPTFVKRRLLTDEEKYRRAIFFYTYYDFDFELVYEDEDHMLDEYGQAILNIEANFKKLDDETKTKVLDFVKRDVYDETVDFKCLKCNKEQFNVDFEMIEEDWDGTDYPILYCPFCNKPKFVPLDIWNAINKR